MLYAVTRSAWQVLSCLGLADGRIMFSTHPFVYLLPNWWTRCWENELTDSNASWRKWSAGQGHETFNFWGQEVKGFGGVAEVSFLTPWGWVAFALCFRRALCMNWLAWFSWQWVRRLQSLYCAVVIFAWLLTLLYYEWCCVFSDFYVTNTFVCVSLCIHIRSVTPVC